MPTEVKISIYKLVFLFTFFLVCKIIICTKGKGRMHLPF